MKDLMEFRPEEGELSLNHTRMVVFNVDALGTLRKELIDNLGFERAKSFLLRYGWNLGYNDAINVKGHYKWSSDREWISAGPAFATLEGISKVNVDTLEFDRKERFFLLNGEFINSFEVTQHIRYFGLSDTPVCWILIGYAGGYATAFFGETVIYKEIKCKGKGDPCCCFEGRTLSQWGNDEVVRNELPYYEDHKISEEINIAYKRIQVQHQQLKRIISIHQQLHELILNREGIPGILKKTASIVNGSVLLFDTKLRLMAIEILHSKDAFEDLRQKLTEYFTNDLHSDSSQSSILTDKLPLTIETMINTKLCWVTAVSLMTGIDILGYIAVIQEEKTDKEELIMILQRAADALVLDIMRQKEITDLEHKFRSDFIDALLFQRYTNKEALVEWGMRLGCDISKSNYVLAMEIKNKDSCEIKSEEEMVVFKKQVLQITSDFLKTKHQITPCTEIAGQIVIILPHNAAIDKSFIRNIIAKLGDKITQQFPHTLLYVGVGNITCDSNNFRESYQQAQKTLKTIKIYNTKENQILFYDELGSLEALIYMQDKDKLLDFITIKLRSLLEYDEEHKSDLLNTLEQYLSIENIRKTAQLTSLSVSGLKYRLNIIKELGYDLRDPHERFDLKLAIKIYKICL